MKLLTIDTATQVCGVALTENGSILKRAEYKYGSGPEWVDISPNQNKNKPDYKPIINGRYEL